MDSKDFSSLGKYGDIQANSVDRMSEIWRVKTLAVKALKKLGDRRFQSIIDCQAFSVRDLEMVGLESRIVDIYKSEYDNYKYIGLNTCKRIWCCPYCAMLASVVRGTMVRNAIYSWVTDGVRNVKDSLVLVTLTYKNSIEDDDLYIRKFANARKRFFENGSVKRYFEKFVLGRIYTLEFTVSDLNGFHIHVHILMFVFGSNVDVEEIKDFVYRYWYESLLKEGLECDYLHGVNVERSDDIKYYITKMSGELLGSVNKVGRVYHYSPFQLLTQWEKKGDKWALDMFGRYVGMTYRIKNLVWSRGLKGFFDVDTDCRVIRKKILSIFAKDYYRLDSVQKAFLVSKVDLQQKLEYLENIGIDVIND